MPTRIRGARVIVALLLGAGAGLATACTTVNDLTPPSCAYSASPEAATFGQPGGTGVVAVTASGVCGWTATSDASWITLPEGNSGTGNGRVPFVVAPNALLASRSATLTAAGQTVRIQQDATSCHYVVTPASANFGPAGGAATFDIGAETACAWTATSRDQWIKFSGTGPAAGAGPGKVAYTVDPNPETSARTGHVGVGNQLVAVAQAAGGAASAPPDPPAAPAPAPGADPAPAPPPPPPPPPPPACAYTVSPTSKTFDNKPHTDHVSVTTSASCAWIATSSDSWLTIDPKTTAGIGDADITYSVGGNNSKKDRTATITVNGAVATITQRK